MDIIHIVANIEPLNMGVWASCLRGEEAFMKSGIYSHFWSCSENHPGQVTKFKALDLKETPIPEIVEQMSAHFKKEETLIITHGAWLAPSRIGFYASKAGFPWIYVPQGMLEPWSMNQNKFFKNLYFNFFEKKYLKNVVAIRAVSLIEKGNLEKLFPAKVFYVPNAVAEGNKNLKEEDKTNFVFMGRLHHKKGILPLAMAWNKTLNSNPNAHLYIAGQDEGELNHLQPYLGGNMEYLGPVYGQEKINLLKKAHYFILPSFSEGFPSSVLEAMSYGAIPIISSGCNFEEVFQNDLGYKAEPQGNSLENVLKSLFLEKYDQQKSNRNVEWIQEHYTENKIAQDLIQEYSTLLKNVHKGK